ncbi:carboxypeptidase-like regulatory domain-containing protein [Marinoscillum sp. MHG1-6]|uniref:carboxypeptidase-like regulatory domain-containing protein n=1 Tax=Marinoscillum sp. MHG1-6 TaxID=2959627 RepID=UPI0021572D5D|nr:carboxypeptidase-like regulatory domain-containing protein [Marinoscillum sp. MHG1-6]
MKSFLFVIAFSLSLLSFGQTIKGYVVNEDNEPVIGAKVMEAGSRNGTTTNIDGSFLVMLNDSSSQLIFSFVGYETDSLLLTNEKLNQVVLKKQPEVVVEAESSPFSYFSDYRFWLLAVWVVIIVWLVLRTFRGVASA